MPNLSKRKMLTLTFNIILLKLLANATSSA